MKVAILGFGKSGRTAEKLLLKKGTKEITIYDDNIPGYQKLSEFDDKYDMIVVSPGIDPSKLRVDMDKVTSELELAYEFIKNKTLLGVTGTNGKSTITFLTANILKNAGYNVEYCGNIGVTLGDMYLENDPEIYVVEVSSFQLDLLKIFEFYSSCISNITPDHLDRYGSMEKYILSKKRIADFTKKVVYLEENEGWNRYFSDVKYISVDPKLRKWPKLLDNRLEFGDFYLDIRGYRLFGFHNLINLAFAILMADTVAAFKGDITHLVENLTALEHRCEYVGTVNGVKYINDSKGTNVDSTLTALKSSSYPTTLLLGGKDKDGDFTTLVDEIDNKCSLVICFGGSGGKIYNALKGRIKSRIELVERLKDAVILAKELTKVGTVLFSPACASFDEFKNFEERGRYFKTLVKGFEKSDD
ncbi:MAG: UDP-N-acetylmuramoyl-L-alanine--D-glutamate ligase [Calditerrivibrio sp.]|nr:UDP-N-acetylmuramoyl-L-alanine--D-glutamate ligase [Calditerrivibrio sp.]